MPSNSRQKPLKSLKRAANRTNRANCTVLITRPVLIVSYTTRVFGPVSEHTVQKKTLFFQAPHSRRPSHRGEPEVRPLYSRCVCTVGVRVQSVCGYSRYARAFARLKLDHEALYGILWHRGSMQKRLIGFRPKSSLHAAL